MLCHLIEFEICWFFIMTSAVQNKKKSVTKTTFRQWRYRFKLVLLLEIVNQFSRQIYGTNDNKCHLNSLLMCLTHIVSEKNLQKLILLVHILETLSDFAPTDTLIWSTQRSQNPTFPKVGVLSSPFKHTTWHFEVFAIRLIVSNIRFPMTT